MINETFSLSEALNKFDINPHDWHREYKELPKASDKAPCFRVWITESGQINNIEQLDHELVKVLRKYGNNQASFPAFNIKPLYRITDERQRREDNWLKSMKRIDKSLDAISGDFMNAISNTDGEVKPVVEKLVTAAGELARYGFRKSLEEYLLSTIENGETGLVNILEFEGTDNKAPENDMGANISVIFDLAEWRNYGYPIASEETTNWINDALNRHKSEDVSSGQFDGRDAFGDSFDKGAKAEPMPEVKLPGFGVTLRSMFNGQPCQERYGRFDDASYPISKPNRISTKGALEWIAKSDNERITWVKADTNEIVFAYPSELPEILLPYAGIMGGMDADKRFEEITEGFLTAFRGQPPERLPEFIQVFSIRKMDRGRSKTVFTRNMPPEGYIKAAEEWQEGCLNIPEIAFVEPKVPFPLSAARIINTVWKQDGEQIKRRDGTPIVKRMQTYQGMELMLDTGNETAVSFMSILVQNAFGLVVFAGNERFLSPYHLKNIADAAMMIGLILHKCDCRKEDYMKDTAFLMGQFLKVSDELHVLYCKIVRGDVPPQLVGASMLTAASDMPEKALAQLCMRMSPYITWAKSYRYKNIKEEGKESWRAIWLVNLYETIAGPLREKLIESVRFNDFEKAQLFLGYLAAFPKRDASSDGTESDIDMNKGEKEND